MAKVKEKRNVKVVCVNRKARHDYFVDDEYEAGLVLTGAEVKSLRDGRANLKDGYAKIRKGEIFIYQIHIGEYPAATYVPQEPLRVRKLLMHKHEIYRLEGKIKNKGIALIPLEIYFSNGRAKITIAMCRGKRQHDKRDAIQEREHKREMDRAKKKDSRD
ncbi:MAG: SsrA-binding protein SmpB [Deltaproteobacteria bacterium]|nr:SsrA-binding protein SmpB [Deltaproteobacteria bacterium]